VKRSNRLVILVGVLLAVLAFVGIVYMLNNGGGTGGPEESNAQTVTVLVADRDIAIGEEVKPADVSKREVDLSAVVGTRLTDPSQVSGRPALYHIPRGSQVPVEAFQEVGAPKCISCLLQPGEKAIAFQVDRVTGLDFLIQAGDHIDVVMQQSLQVVAPVTQTGPANEWKYEVVTSLDGAVIVKTVLQNKRVLYVSSTRVPPTTGAEPTPTPSSGTPAQQPAITSVIIIIAGTDQDAELIKFAQSNVSVIGNLTAVIRAADDAAPETTSGLTLALLLQQYGVPVPDVVVLERSNQ
jgi:Flp pilus assembly protein CpaB